LILEPLVIRSQFSLLHTHCQVHKYYYKKRKGPCLPLLIVSSYPVNLYIRTYLNILIKNLGASAPRFNFDFPWIRSLKVTGISVTFRPPYLHFKIISKSKVFVFSFVFICLQTSFLIARKFAEKSFISAPVISRMILFPFLLIHLLIFIFRVVDS
jgi:hypothetical protein